MSGSIPMVVITVIMHNKNNKRGKNRKTFFLFGITSQVAPNNKGAGKSPGVPFDSVGRFQASLLLLTSTYLKYTAQHTHTCPIFSLGKMLKPWQSRPQFALYPPSSLQWLAALLLGAMYPVYFRF